MRLLIGTCMWIGLTAPNNRKAIQLFLLQAAFTSHFLNK